MQEVPSGEQKLPFQGGLLLGGTGAPETFLDTACEAEAGVRVWDGTPAGPTHTVPGHPGCRIPHPVVSRAVSMG